MPQNQKTEAAELADLNELPHVTPAEHEFIRLLVHEGKTATAAYRESHPHEAADLSDSALWARSSRLRGDARIQEWVQALKAYGMARGLMTHEQYITDMQGLSARAEMAGNYGASVNAMREAGQAAGLKEQKIEVTHKTDATQLIEQLQALFGPQQARQAALGIGIVLEGEYTDSANE